MDSSISTSAYLSAKSRGSAASVLQRGRSTVAAGRDAGHRGRSNATSARRLLIRSNRGVTLTAAGEICARRGSSAPGQLSDAVDGIDRVPANTQRRLDPTDSRAAHLQALNAVVEHRNFTLAARALHISQPTIHRAARELERLLGVPLFEKTSFGIVPDARRGEPRTTCATRVRRNRAGARRNPGAERRRTGTR